MIETDVHRETGCGWLGERTLLPLLAGCVSVWGGIGATAFSLQREKDNEDARSASSPNGTRCDPPHCSIAIHSLLFDRQSFISSSSHSSFTSSLPQTLHPKKNARVSTQLILRKAYSSSHTSYSDFRSTFHTTSQTFSVIPFHQIALLQLYLDITNDGPAYYIVDVLASGFSNLPNDTRNAATMHTPSTLFSKLTAKSAMVVTKQVSSQLEWLSTLSTTFDAMDENEKFLRKVS
jgi:hypothetical protein